MLLDPIEPDLAFLLGVSLRITGTGNKRRQRGIGSNFGKLHERPDCRRDIGQVGRFRLLRLPEPFVSFGRKKVAVQSNRKPSTYVWEVGVCGVLHCNLVVTIKRTHDLLLRPLVSEPGKGHYGLTSVE